MVKLREETKLRSLWAGKGTSSSSTTSKRSLAFQRVSVNSFTNKSQRGIAPGKRSSIWQKRSSSNSQKSKAVIAGARTLLNILSAAVGKPCWHVSVGGCTLPTFSLAIGGKVARERPLENRQQPAVFRQFEPEVAFYVWCAWRLEQGTSILTTSDGTDTEIVRGLKHLVGQRLTAIEVTPPAWDLTLGFANDLRLKVFCDHAGKDPSFSFNWDADIGNRCVTAGAGTTLEIKDKEQ